MVTIWLLALDSQDVIYQTVVWAPASSGLWPTDKSDSCRGLVFAFFSVFCDVCDFSQNSQFSQKSLKSTLFWGTCLLQLFRVMRFLCFFAKIATLLGGLASLAFQSFAIFAFFRKNCNCRKNRNTFWALAFSCFTEFCDFCVFFRENFNFRICVRTWTYLVSAPIQRHFGGKNVMPTSF